MSLDEGRLAADGDRFLQARDLHRNVDVERLADVEDDALALDTCEKPWSSAVMS